MQRSAQRSRGASLLCAVVAILVLGLAGLGSVAFANKATGQQLAVDAQRLDAAARQVDEGLAAGDWATTSRRVGGVRRTLGPGGRWLPRGVPRRLSGHRSGHAADRASAADGGPGRGPDPY